MLSGKLARGRTREKNSMAQKRMFDRSVIETRNFLMMSLTSKALYFLLGMEADDEGFVDPERVLRIYGGEIGDIKNLIDAGLVIPFQTGVVVITHWKQNNWLDDRRTKPTQYQKEKGMLTLTEQKKYEFSTCLASIEERSIEESRIEESNTGEDKSSQIPILIKLFESVNPSISRMYGNKTQRASCKRLIDTYGIEKLEKIIKVLPRTNSTKYAPTITTPLHLEDKMAQLLAFLRKEQSNQPIL